MKVETPVTPIREARFSAGEPVLSAKVETVIFHGCRYGFTIPFPEASDEWFNGKPPAWWDEDEWEHYMEDAVFPNYSDIPGDAQKYISQAEVGYKITVTDADSKNVCVLYGDIPSPETQQWNAKTAREVEKVA